MSETRHSKRSAEAWVLLVEHAFPRPSMRKDRRRNGPSPGMGIAVPDDPERPPPDATPNCEKCGQPTALVTVIGRLGKVPAYRIFRCDACEALQWIAEKIAGGDESA
jgi:hypothetical protein